MQKSLTIFLIVILSVAGVFYACKKEAVPQPPVANAGPDQAITLPANTVILDGSPSFSQDPNNKISSYQWRQIGGASVTIASANTEKTQVTGLTEGAYEFELKVTAGGQSDKDTVLVRVGAPHPPVANAGVDQTINQGIFLPAYLILDGSASTDPDNNITRYQWRQIAGGYAYLDATNYSFRPQVTGLGLGAYKFELTVTDNDGLSDKDTVEVRVSVLNTNGATVFIAGNIEEDVACRNPDEGCPTNSYPTLWITPNNNNYRFDYSAFPSPDSYNYVFVYGTDIYVAGGGKNASGNSVAKLWKNGTAQNLTYGQVHSSANSVFVYNGDVYVAGYEVNASGNSVATLWENGTPKSLSDGQANSVFVYNSNVYVAGYEVNATGNSVATLWENGTAKSLSDGQANSVFVYNGNVYVAGYEVNASGQSVAKLWINGVGQNSAGVNSVFVYNDDVYVAGQELNASGKSVAKLWKNGTVLYNLSDGQYHASASSVYVFNGDVYVVGQENNYPVLWQNGAAFKLSESGTAGSVFVK